MLIYLTETFSSSLATERHDPDNSWIIQQILGSNDVPPEHDTKSLDSPHQTNAMHRISDLSTELVLSLFPELNTKIEGTNNTMIILKLYSRLQAISLERHNGELLLSIQRLFGPLHQDAWLQYLRFFIYLSSNNMLSKEHSKHFLQRITKSKTHLMLKAFFSIKMSTIEVLAENLFPCALEISVAIKAR
jgi:hypothetical protein